MKSNELHFRVDAPTLLQEVVDNAVGQNQGVIKIPMNILRNYLGKVAQRAIEIDDPELNIIMLEMNLYEVPPKEIVKTIEAQKKRIK